jgi:hypothetical protein
MTNINIYLSQSDIHLNGEYDRKFPYFHYKIKN